MLEIAEFIWDEGNIHKPQRHGIIPGEAEEVFFNDPYFRRTRSSRYSAWGQTDAGRYLIVIFEYQSRSARVITAREMNISERRLYLRERRNI
jgi:uncharacterized DUF497 family protein